MSKQKLFYVAEVQRFASILNANADRVEKHRQLNELAKGMQSANGVILPTKQRRIDAWRELLDHI